LTEKIIVTANIGVQNGPSITVNRVIEVQAYEKINIDINKDVTDKVVGLWPSDKNGEVLLLAITSSWYGTDKQDSSFVTYKVNDEDKVSFNLDQPHLLIGNSSVTMLNSTPKQLKFSYKQAGTAPDSIQIQILIGLKVTS
jgi:hypothetical protein